MRDESKIIEILRDGLFLFTLSATDNMRHCVAMPISSRIFPTAQLDTGPGVPPDPRGAGEVATPATPSPFCLGHIAGESWPDSTYPHQKSHGRKKIADRHRVRHSQIDRGIEVVVCVF